MAGLPDAELACRFESLGRNCEFGFVQRLAGAEPMGLLRFAGMPFESLLRALGNRFADIAEPGDLEVWLDGDEYRIAARNLGLNYHTQLHRHEIGPDELYRIECRKTRFLRSRLLDDLDRGRKIFVYQQKNELQPRDRAALLVALAGYGRVTLLWVVEATDDHPAGSVSKIDDALMIGHVVRLAPGESAHQPHLASWLAVCREAHRLWTGDETGEPGGAGPELSNITFGTGGIAALYQAGGWSEPEFYFTWTLGRQSALTLPWTRDAELMLGLQLSPYVDPPAVPSQRLSVNVNGVEVASFTVTHPSFLHCPVPAAVLGLGDDIRIVLRHPDAARPSAASSGNGDDRELAFALHRTTLAWV